MAPGNSPISFHDQPRAIAPAPAGDAQDAATMQKMQANMKTMRELMGGETTIHHPMMQDRMNMMQMMMDQMMQREDVSESKSEKPAQ